MEDVQFSDAFCRFVQVHLPSVEAAEALIAAFRDPQNPLPGGKHADALRAGGLLDEGYRFRPPSDEIKAHAATLSQAYEERPVTLVRLIYALRDNKIRSFADAFKLRK
jgi:hypothetical protein